MKTTDKRPYRSTSKCLRIPAGRVFLLADLHVPREASALVILAYEFGRSVNHPRTRHVARILRDHGLGTLLCNLLTEEEEIEDEASATYRHDAELLAKRLLAASKWAASEDDTKGLRLAYFGICTAGAAAMIAAAKAPKRVAALVSRGGCLDLAANSVPRVTCPTLLIVGKNDLTGRSLSLEALERMTCEKKMILVPGASRLFGEPGKLETMADLAAKWLRHHLDEPET